MTAQVISSVAQVTADWLTSVLSRSGALTRGTVVSFHLGTGQGNWSTSAHLAVEYSDDARGSLPQRLFLKMVDTNVDEDDDESFDGSEVAYYARDYVDVKNAPLIHCYDAVYSGELKRYHILLDDVSETHIEAAEKEPTLESGQVLAEALATLHARWWGAQRLSEAGAPMHTPQHIQRFVDIAEPGVGHILGQFSNELEPHWPNVLADLCVRHPPAMIDRTRNVNGFTLIHGDVGHNNILVPRRGDRPVYIIDRQPFNWSLTTWLGVYDLAHAMVLDWNTEIRRRCEIPILRRYHEHLLRNGVANYPWEQLYDDYRLCVAMGVYIATEYCRGGVNERWLHVWLPMLQRALRACDDLDCSALWRR
jgi:hypothetical protein